MFRRRTSKLSLLAACTVVSVSALATDPTLHRVYQAADAGNYREAQSMMDQVLRDHPNSAKAHFVEAELLAKQGHVANAQAELAKAEHLAPGLPFAKPGAVQELKSRIAAMHSSVQSATPYVAPSSSTGMPWGALLIGAALLVALYLFFRARTRNAGVGMPAYNGNAINMPSAAGATGYGAPAYGAAPPPVPGGIGSGILGGLATGAAVGAGMVAGEALMHRVLDGGRREDSYRQGEIFTDTPQSRAADSNYDMGGNDFGVADASSWDDSGGGGDGSDDWS